MSQISACRREEPETLLACTERAIYWKSQQGPTEWHALDVDMFALHAREKARAAANKGHFSVLVPVVELDSMSTEIDLSSPPPSVIDAIRKEDPSVRVRFVGPDWAQKLLRYALICFCSSNIRKECVHGAYVLNWRPAESQTKS